MSTPRDISIRVPVLARVEGEGALELDVSDGAISTLRLNIYEPPRLFEKLMLGYAPDQVVDMVARICGICPVAYQVTAVHAFEHLGGLDVGPWARAMRRAMYCGEWLQSHALHIHLLAAPDFLGFDNAIAMAERYPDEVRRGLRLQGLGNALIGLFGGRSVHPVGLRVGGFYRAPDRAAVDALNRQLDAAVADAKELVRWCAALPMPDDQQTFTSVSLRDADDYPLQAGRIVSSTGLDLEVGEFDRHMREFQVPHSTALHAELDGAPYLVGPLARLNLNHDRLPADVASLLRETGIEFPSRNMFHSMLARAVEICVAIREARRLLDDYREPDRPAVPWPPMAGVAVAATEAPRGLLWQRYETDADGHVTDARIVPPTSQNQARCEADLRASLNAFGLDRDDDELRLRAETVIRNYDPCISCATHFLRLKVRR